MMGTLSSCSITALNFRFLLNPTRGGLNERLLLDSSKSNNLCLLCNGMRRRRGSSWRGIDKFRCFSGEGDKEEETTMFKKGEDGVADDRSSSDGFKPDQTPPASVSSRPPTAPPSNSFQVDSFKLLELLGPEKVDPADVKLIKDKLFGYSTFWVTKEEPFGDLGEGVLFLGNLRGKREDVFAKLQLQLAEATGDKYNLFMVEEPNLEEPDPRGGPRVSFGLLRKEVSEPGSTSLWQYLIAFLLFLLTIGSSVELGIASQLNRLPPEVVKYFTDPNATDPPDIQLLLPFVESALPLAYGVLGVQLFHEVGHFLAAFPKNVKLGIPYFIPNITLGSFGAITQFKSILPDRRTQVDISLAGPFAGAALSFSMFCVGLLLSSKSDAAADLVQVPSMLFQGSLLLGLISRATLGYASMHAATVAIHPLVIAGWCGLTTSAFNMLPVGCLDGGRAVQGAFGKNSLAGFGLATYALLGLGVLGGPLSLPWGLYVLICQRTPEKPCLNDVSEVGQWRKTALIIAIVLVALTLLPLWDELAEELDIDLENPVLHLSPFPIVDHSFTRATKDTLLCGRIRVAGLSRLKIWSYANSFRVTLTPSMEIPERLHGRIEVCFHQNASLGLCQCEKDVWRPIQMGQWSVVMSPYQDTYVDVKFVNVGSGSVKVSLEEESHRWRLVCLAFGFVLLLLAPIFSNWVPFYYSSSMAFGILLVVIIILFQAMKLLPTGRKSAFYFTIYGSMVGVGSLLLRYFSMLVSSILINFGLSEDMYNPVSVFVVIGIVLGGAGLGYWMVRKFIISEDGSIDVGIAQFVKWAMRIIATTSILLSSMDIPLALVALTSCWGTCLLLTSPGRIGLGLMRWSNPTNKNLWLRRAHHMAPNRNRAEFLSRSANTASRRSPWSSPKRSFAWSASPSKDLVLSPSNQSASPHQDYYSTFHKTPTRRRFSKKEWEDFTQESTRQALAEWASSPEFIDWVVENADRIRIEPEDEGMGSGSESTYETGVDNSSGISFLKW